MLFVIAIILCAWFPYVFIRRAEGRFDDLLESLALVLILSGMLLRISARGHKAEHSSAGTRLVTGGPYAAVRNPMYLGILVAGTGVVLLIGNLWGWLLFLAAFLLQYLYLFKKEEGALERSFGEDYREYKKTVPQLIPRFRQFFAQDIRIFLPLKAKWFRREMTAIVPVLLGTMAIEFREEMISGGWKALLYALPPFLIVIAVFALLVNFLTEN